MCSPPPVAQEPLRSATPGPQGSPQRRSRSGSSTHSAPPPTRPPFCPSPSRLLPPRQAHAAEVITSALAVTFQLEHNTAYPLPQARVALPTCLLCANYRQEPTDLLEPNLTSRRLTQALGLASVLITLFTSHIVLAQDNLGGAAAGRAATESQRLQGNGRPQIHPLPVASHASPDYDLIVAITSSVLAGALLIAWLASRRTSPNPERVPLYSSSPSTLTAGAATEDKKCPDCAEVVRAEARVCRFCGHQWTPNRRAGRRPNSQAIGLGLAALFIVAAVVFFIRHTTGLPPECRRLLARANDYRVAAGASADELLRMEEQIDLAARIDRELAQKKCQELLTSIP